ncbi:DUF58 domain-containing protein [Hahella sp. KA22]|uniref:DUF58 domain-containing protein n=1 Tax=Hahella sp. KA22 TaxID=1628392 RepID=UPI000FDF308C|nr:DUF58 domain-containing protein [Hahella sp. KA22]AZZ91325.1 DUF58 domain-containing protein [Hahella sp. KA22]QAY54694.1 DUF58 domain-containing protein [Hahella sp. KA22]
MNQHRVYCQLDELIQLRIAAARLSLRFDPRKLQQQAGAHLSRFRGRGMDFAEYRPYQEGDDPRSIDWKVTARRSRPFTKVFHEEVERPILILVDQSISLFFGSRRAFKSVLAAEIASLLAWAGLAQGDRIGGLVFSHLGHQALKPSRHPRQALRILECVNSFNQALSLQQSETRFSFNDALLELRRIARPGSQCFIISDWRQFDATSKNLLFDLRRHSQVLPFQVFDPLEQTLPPGNFRITDGSSHLDLDTRNERLSLRLKNEYEQWQNQLLQELASIGLACARLSTWEDPAEKLHQLQFSNGARGAA